MVTSIYAFLIEIPVVSEKKLWMSFLYLTLAFWLVFFKSLQLKKPFFYSFLLPFCRDEQNYGGRLAFRPTCPRPVQQSLRQPPETQQSAGLPNVCQWLSAKVGGSHIKKHRFRFVWNFPTWRLPQKNSLSSLAVILRWFPNNGVGSAICGSL